MQTIRAYLYLVLGTLILLMSFACTSKDDEFEKKRAEYNKKLTRGLRDNDTTVHGVKLLPIQ